MQKPPFAKLDLCQTQTSCGNVAPAVMANRPECRQLSSSASHNVGQQSPANSSGKRLPEKQGWLPQYAGQIKWTAKSLGLSDCTRHGTAKTQTIFCELYRTRPQNQWWRTRKKKHCHPFVANIPARTISFQWMILQFRKTTGFIAISPVSKIYNGQCKSC